MVGNYIMIKNTYFMKLFMQRHLYKDLATADLQFESNTTATDSTHLRERGDQMAAVEKSKLNQSYLIFNNNLQVTGYKL